MSEVISFSSRSIVSFFRTVNLINVGLSIIDGTVEFPSMEYNFPQLP